MFNRRSIDAALDDDDHDHHDDNDAIEGASAGGTPQKRSNREQKFQGVEENHFQSSKFRRNETQISNFFMKTVERVCIREQKEREHIYIYGICICSSIYRKLCVCVCDYINICALSVVGGSGCSPIARA